MNKRLIGRLILLIGLILAITVAHDYYIDEKKYNSEPRHFSSYLDSGYYKIDSKTILTALDQGETDIFTPLLEDPNLVEALTNASLSWTQADFLQIANALSKLVWKEPLDLKGWNVYEISFTRYCQSNGFDSGEITYFKTYGTNGREVYTTRHIEIDPYFSMVKWGGGTSYPRPILYKWNSVDLIEAKITADDALRITEENGKKEALLRESDECLMNLRAPISQKTNDDRWEVSVMGEIYFKMFIDPYTSEYEIVNMDQ